MYMPQTLAQFETTVADHVATRWRIVANDVTVVLEYQDGTDALGEPRWVWERRGQFVAAVLPIGIYHWIKTVLPQAYR